MARREPWALITCEHAHNRVPSAFADCLRGQEHVLASHRGYDPGALRLARDFARRFDAPLLVAPVTRLLVDCNRSPQSRSLFSEFSRPLPPDRRAELVARYYLPHRNAVERAVRDAVAAQRRVVHIAVHSFAPSIEGVERRVDVGLLYDPARRAEQAFCRAWRAELEHRIPELRVRMNSPYRGIADGLPTALRKHLGERVYTGIELEINQAFPLRGGAAWSRLRHLLTASLHDIL